ncbi:CRISPR-associated protein Cas4 [Sulfolobus acidocaldarius]|uniref:CRISPR-associated exonuclease Cas4 n=4 Tax=Sulfolobus acidocaldarius TaxID=2285 RepID=Q4JBY9_SULAC|nr:CRISPR-associated protein Cas4 [Sulfolobus acidocaldarius]AAY79690.1 conserved protein [Sulfolobus acidocaldarius DSM 639]AGE70249.1 CRISPR-associated protein Cas4 [Sulfolobus acidocaldarius N8]AGE72524.1 CRISPR-associated protein Cas4 [Sulfolobus acidocaldarius Ron12/I]ALU29347.1 CRISPR-associated protein Cas4 [Sulfolobus acidocaldarius]ALU32076.1 CRISPR-associated protein Cas4 [Sulfolobus acidocaldarius]
MLIEALINSKIKDYMSHQREEGVLYVTDLLRCPMKLRFETMYKEIALSEAFTPATMLGDLVHLGLQEFIKSVYPNSQIEVEGEKTIPVDGKEIKIKGRADAIIQINDEKVIVEIKSARADRSLPHEHHKYQLQIYLWLFGIKRGLLVYITPDRVTEYSVNEPAEEVTIIRLAEETLKAKIAPRYSWECEYCAFKTLCPYKKIK